MYSERQFQGNGSFRSQDRNSFCHIHANLTRLSRSLFRLRCLRLEPGRTTMCHQVKIEIEAQGPSTTRCGTPDFHVLRVIPVVFFLLTMPAIRLKLSHEYHNILA